MTAPLRALILEDRPSDAELVIHELQRAGFDLEWKRVDTEADYRASLELAWDVILADYSIPQFDAPQALGIAQARGLDTPIIIISGTVGEEVAVECIKLGAADYLLKDRLVTPGTGGVESAGGQKTCPGKAAGRGGPARIGALCSLCPGWTLGAYRDH